MGNSLDDIKGKIGRAFSDGDPVKDIFLSVVDMLAVAPAAGDNPQIQTIESRVKVLEDRFDKLDHV